MLIDVVAILVIVILSAVVGFLAYRVFNDGRFIFKAARYELLHGKGHVFLSGAAGTGKTRLISELQKLYSDVVVVAPTALAANTVGGSTIHSLFKFPPTLLLPDQVKPNQAGRQVISRLHTIVIDEVSMVRVDVMDAMDRDLRRYRNQPDVPFGGVRMIFVGDLFQLPPVTKNEGVRLLHKSYIGVQFFNAPAFSEIRYASFDLKKAFRQKDKAFSKVLSKIRRARHTTKDLDVINSRVLHTYEAGQEVGTMTIVFTNAKAERVNAMLLDKLSGALFQSKTVYSGQATNDLVGCEDLVMFKVGAQIVFINNDKSGQWYNGLTGTITGVNGEIVTVTSRDGRRIDVSKVEFIVWDYVAKDGIPERVASGTALQYPFKLGWAITAHKSQGQTFDRVHIDNTDGKAFAAGQMYVALSRCRRLADLTISRRIDSTEIMVDKAAEEYMSGLGMSEP
jgi:ribosomal protein L21E